MESEGKRLKKIRDAELKRRDKAKLRELAERIRQHRHARRTRIQEIRGLCRIGRQNLRASVMQLRDETKLKLKQTIAELRQAEREKCGTSQQTTRAELARHIEQARRELAVELRAFKERYGRRAASPGVARARARERASESDDDVLRNLPPELEAVFLRVRSGIKGSARMSRTEAFLHWAEENPDEVHGILYSQADRDVERLIREHTQTERRLAKGHRAYDDPEAQAHALSAVPF